MQSSACHKANMLAEKSRTQMQNIQSSVLQALEEQKSQENSTTFTSCKKFTDRIPNINDRNNQVNARHDPNHKGGKQQPYQLQQLHQKQQLKKKTQKTQRVAEKVGTQGRGAENRISTTGHMELDTTQVQCTLERNGYHNTATLANNKGGSIEYC